MLSLLTASKDTKKRRDLQILDKRNMEGNLFDKVSNDKLDMLHEALSEVISDMRYAGESVDATFTDEAFWACLSIRNMVFASLRRHEINKGSRL